jgi:hypothetical protein
MIDALFWYTGLAAWILIVFACVWMLVVLVSEPTDHARRQHFSRL